MKAACPNAAKDSILPCPKRCPLSAGIREDLTAQKLSKEAPASKDESIKLDNSAIESVIAEAKSLAAIKTNAAPVEAAAAAFIKNAEDFFSDTAEHP